MNVCILGNAGVGKKTCKNIWMNTFNVLILPSPRDVTFRKQLQTHSPFVFVFIVTTEAGRLHYEDAECFKPFRERRGVVVIVNKTPYNAILENMIKNSFEHAPQLYFIPHCESEDALNVRLVNSITLVESVTPQPFIPFVFPFEELEKMRQEDIIAKRNQEAALQAAESARQKAIADKDAAELAFSRSCSTGARTLEEHYRIVREIQHKLGF
jgi:hypothetical protein